MDSLTDPNPAAPAPTPQEIGAALRLAVDTMRESAQEERDALANPTVYYSPPDLRIAAERDVANWEQAAALIESALPGLAAAPALAREVETLRLRVTELEAAIAIMMAENSAALRFLPASEWPGLVDAIKRSQEVGAAIQAGRRAHAALVPPATEAGEGE